MSINHDVINFLAKQSAASKTYRVNHSQQTSKPSSGMQASHSSKPRNTQSPHRLGRKVH
jgi:hypothetical protein